MKTKDQIVNMTKEKRAEYLWFLQNQLTIYALADAFEFYDETLEEYKLVYALIRVHDGYNPHA